MTLQKNLEPIVVAFAMPDRPRLLLSARLADTKNSSPTPQLRTIGRVAVSFFALAIFAGSAARCEVPRGYFTNIRPLADPADSSRFPNVNPGSVEAAPAIPADGRTLFFTSDRAGGEGDFDLYQATRATRDGVFGEVMNLGPEVNTAAGDVKPVISTDGLTLYFASDRSGGQGDVDVYQATRTSVNDPFGNVTNMETINTRFYDSPSHLSPDGRRLYFSSDKPSGRGAFDLYVATREDQNEPFGNVTGIGSGINSPNNEFSLTISSDGLTMFFAEFWQPPFRSEGHGGSDIWMATRESADEAFGKPVNLNSTLGSEVAFGGVNSSNNDRNPAISREWPAPGSKLYFERFTGQGDIYEATWVPAPLLGDYDGSGGVDQRDLDLVLLNWGVRTHPRTLPDAWSGVPATGQTVDQHELDNVLLEWGHTVSVGNGSGAGPVPEPATSALLLVSLAAVLAMARPKAQVYQRRRTMNRSIAGCLAILAMVSAGQARAGKIYTPHARHTRLGTIDPVTGVGTDVGSFEMPDFRLASGAFDTQNQFYSLAGLPDFTSQLAIVDTSTGFATLVGSPIDTPLLPLEIDNNDTIYSVQAVFPEFNLGGEATLVTLDKSTGQVTPIGDTGVARAMDLAFSSDGTLWAVGGAEGGNQLYTIDTTTGASMFQAEITGVAEATGIDGAEIMGIMFDEHDTLLATSFYGEQPDYMSPLFSIDKATGAASVIGNTGFVLPHGGDYLIPEPASLRLALLSGMLLMATAGRKLRARPSVARSIV